MGGSEFWFHWWPHNAGSRCHPSTLSLSSQLARWRPLAPATTRLQTKTGRLLEKDSRAARGGGAEHTVGSKPLSSLPPPFLTNRQLQPEQSTLSTHTKHTLMSENYTSTFTERRISQRWKEAIEEQNKGNGTEGIESLYYAS